MSKLASGSGDYFILDTAYDGDLAITYNGVGSLLTVTKQGSRDGQVWTISDTGDGETQTIFPKGRPDLQILSGPGFFLKVVPGSGKVWTVKGDEIYFIRGDDQTSYWSIRGPSPGQLVSKSFAPDDDHVKAEQWWVLSNVY